MFEENKNCFACGPENEYGLHLEIRADDKGAECEFVPNKKWEGYNGIMHGGITATILDEIMVYAAFGKRLWSVTADFKVKYVKPVPLGEKVYVKAKVKDIKKKLIYCEAEIRNKEGKILAKGEGRYWIMKKEDLEE